MEEIAIGGRFIFENVKYDMVYLPYQLCPPFSHEPLVASPAILAAFLMELLWKWLLPK